MPPPGKNPKLACLPAGGQMRIQSLGSSYLVLPDGQGPHPGVVVVHEAFGLNDNIRGICQRFAAEGYAATNRQPNPADGQFLELRALADGRVRCPRGRRHPARKAVMAGRVIGGSGTRSGRRRPPTQRGPWPQRDACSK
jgi:Dienelactone hydrolase family